MQQEDPDSTPAPESQEPKRSSRDLSQRFVVQACFPESRRKQRWDAITSYATLMEALRACSECYDTVLMLFASTEELSKDPLDFRIRVWDAEKKEVLVYEDEDGALHCFAEDLLKEESEK